MEPINSLLQPELAPSVCDLLCENEVATGARGSRETTEKAKKEQSPLALSPPPVRKQRMFFHIHICYFSFHKNNCN